MSQCFSHIRSTSLAALLAALLWTAPLRANEAEISEPDCAPSACVPVGEWSFGLSLGAGLRSNPLEDGDVIPLVIIPQVRHYGERFFLENLDLGWTLHNGTALQVNALGSPSFDGVFFNRWDPGNVFVDSVAGGGVVSEADSVETEGVEAGSDADESDAAQDETDSISEETGAKLAKRQLAYMAGLEMSYALENSVIQAALLRDITGRHEGTELRLAYQHRFTARISGTLGLTYKDRKLIDYYYGVDAKEAGGGRAAYSAGASLNPFVRIAAKTPGNMGGWRLGLEWMKLDREIRQSPLVDEGEVVTVFFGRQFVF